LFSSILIQSCTPAIDDCYKVVDDATALVDDAKTRITEISPVEFNQMMEAEEMYILVDVRTSPEHDSGYIPGSVLIQRGQLEFKIANEDFWEEEGMYSPLKDDILVVYCKGGNRSALAVDALKRLGYKKVISLKGGWNSWHKAYPKSIEKNLAPTNLIPSSVTAGEEESSSC
jgi:rhodanese-related sulfurtransferase